MGEKAELIVLPGRSQRLERRSIAVCQSAAGCEVAADLQEALEALQKDNAELRASLAELDRLASTDRLTGVWNRRRLEEAVGSEMERLRRYDHPLSLLVLDVDYFKRVNDRYGHAAGDRLLVEFAARVRAVLRATDSVTRWGGEEFVVLCPESTVSTAALLAERLRQAIAATRFSDVGEVTVSIGAAECMQGESWEQWFHRADEALLRAKAGGRNQVKIAHEAPDRGDSVGKGAGLVRLIWHSAYECGHELVDRQHRGLFQDANNLLGAIISERPERETNALVTTLFGDAVQHFRDEEAVFAAAGYPGSAEHAALHGKLIERAAALVERFCAGGADAGEIFQFLAYDVVAKHLLGADRAFFPYLKRSPGIPEP